MTTKSEAQEHVDRVFRDCMSRDVRDLATIRKEVRYRKPLTLVDWDPTDHELQIMISRNATGTGGEWDYYPAYTRPPRYVSRERVLELASLHTLTDHGRRLLKEMLDDLGRGVAHWRAKHQRAREVADQIEAFVQRAAHEGLGAPAPDEPAPPPKPERPAPPPPRSDVLEYHRNYYKVPARVGGRVTYQGAAGRITGASGPHVEVRLDAGRFLIIHPTDDELQYEEDA